MLGRIKEKVELEVLKKFDHDRQLRADIISCIPKRITSTLDKFRRTITDKVPQHRY